MPWLILFRFVDIHAFDIRLLKSLKLISLLSLKCWQAIMLTCTDGIFQHPTANQAFLLAQSNIINNTSLVVILPEL